MLIAIVICFLAALICWFLAYRWGKSPDATAFLGIIFFTCSAIATGVLGILLLIIESIIFFASLYNQT